MGAIKVLIVDDSALVCEMLTGIFASDSAFEVVGVAHDPYEARDLIKQLNPDVLTLDIEMPRMDGISFLRNLMRLRPMPVVMVSSLTQRGSKQTLDALELGAFDFVAKPHTGDLRDLETEIRRKVRAAAGIGVTSVQRPKPEPTERIGRQGTSIIGIGASTGGTSALRHVLAEMPADSPPIAIVQHLPAAFSKAFAKRLDGVSPLAVTLAEDGMHVMPGHAYVAPGDAHMTVEGRRRVVLRLEKSACVNGHMPAVDPLFASMAANLSDRCIGALMTGMGADGAAGLLAIRRAGGYTLAQDEATSVVWGMPGEAVKRGAACEVVGLPTLARSLVRVVRKQADRRNAAG